jgi:hypothetical protein
MSTSKSTDSHITHTRPSSRMSNSQRQAVKDDYLDSYSSLSEQSLTTFGGLSLFMHIMQHIHVAFLGHDQDHPVWYLRCTETTNRGPRMPSNFPPPNPPIADRGRIKTDDLKMYAKTSDAQGRVLQPRQMQPKDSSNPPQIFDSIELVSWECTWFRSKANH